MYSIPYQLIRNRLKDQMPALKQVDIYLEQYEGKGKLRTTPAALIEFEDITPSQRSNGTSTYPLTFKVHLVTSCAYDDEKRLIGGSAGIAHFIMAEDIVRALQGYNAMVSEVPGLNPVKDVAALNTVNWIHTNPLGGLNDLMVSIHSFKCFVWNYIAEKQYTSTPKPPLEVQ